MTNQAGQDDRRAIVNKEAKSQGAPPPIYDYLRANVEALLRDHYLTDCPPLINALVSLFRNTRSCEHRTVPCSSLHRESEQVLICNTELTALQHDRKIAQQTLPLWCEHWRWTGHTWQCQRFFGATSCGDPAKLQQMVMQDDTQYCPWCGAKKPCLATGS